MNRRLYQLILAVVFLVTAGQSTAKLSINEVDNAIKNAYQGKTGPNFTNAISKADFQKFLADTPTGAFVTDYGPKNVSSDSVDGMVSKVLGWFKRNPTCDTHCTSEFKNSYSTNKSGLSASLSKTAKAAINNEIRNRNNFITYYHGFPNDFRLYQDVLRLIKSYEYLLPMENNYVFRDYFFTDPNLSLKAVLSKWWPEYLAYAKEKGKSPYPEPNESSSTAPGSSVGLRYYPDSIPFVQKYFISTNLNFFGNNISLLNNSLFFFVNSTSATGLSIADKLLKEVLAPYVIGKTGKPDQAKLTSIAASLTAVFKKSMARSGGQLAQIFIKKSVAPEISYVAWNGGEPMWVSNTSHWLLVKDTGGQITFKPPNIFWPRPEIYNQIHRPNIDKYLTLYITNPNSLVNDYLFMSAPSQRVPAALDFLDGNSAKLSKFFIRDYTQARLMPIPKYLTDSNIAGVNLFTFKDVKTQEKADYDQGIAKIVRTVMSDFLQNVSSEKQFKDGTFPLKSAYLKSAK